MRRFLLGAALLALGLCLVRPAAAQPPAEVQAIIDSARRQLAALPPDPPAESPAAIRRELLGRRIALAEELLETAQAAEAAAAGLDGRAEARAQARALEAFRALPPPATPAEPTEHGLQAAKAEVEAETRRLQTLQAEQRESEARLEALPGLLQQALDRQRRADERARTLAAEVAALPEGPGRELAELRLENARLEARLARAAGERFEREARLLRSRTAAHSDRIDLAQQRLGRAERVLELYQAALQDRLAAAQADTVAAVVAAREALERADTPAAKLAARWRLRIAESRAAQAEVAAERVNVERELAHNRRLLVAEEIELSTLQELVTRAEGSERMVEKLKETFQRLDRRRTALEKAEALPVLDDLGEHRAARLEVSDLLYDLNERWREDAAELLERAPAGESRQLQARLASLREEVRAALRDEQAALTELISSAEQLRAVLLERAGVLRRLDTLVRSRIFWVQDAPALGAAPLVQLPTELRRLGRWWRQVAADPRAGKLIAGGAWVFGWLALVLVVLPALLLLARARLRGRLRERGLFALEPHQSAGNRLRIIGFALATALMVPAWFWLASHAVELVELPRELAPVVEALLRQLALVSLLWFLTRLLFGPRRVAEVQLGLPPDVGAALHRALRSIVAAYALLMVPWELLGGAPFRLEVLPRLCYTLFSAALVASLARLLRPGSPLVRFALADFSPRLFRAWAPISVLLASAGAGIVVMDVAGYRYGARQLAGSALWSIGLLVPLLTLWAALRGPVVDRLSRPRRAQAGEETVTERTVRAQYAERFFRFCVVLTALIILAVAWQVDQRAIELFDGIRLYEIATEGGVDHVTVADVLRAGLAMLVTVWLLKAMPRIFSVVVYPYVEADAGLRYAIVTITRYGVFLVGLLVALAAVKLDLGRLGWLMAAVGVGLGFGLQEIVSNFVSGLILLIERPIRIGDFLTIGEVEGRVQRINIRATTVLSLDRQEIIVPNKDLITKEVTNWTHGDPIVRIIVNIAVAQGSDIDRVAEILRAVAVAEPHVVAQPPPEVIFMAQGHGALDFELRVHVGEPSTRWHAIDRLNTAINKRFREAGVEIPFPQRDLHLRSGTLGVRIEAPPDQD